MCVCVCVCIYIHILIYIYIYTTAKLKDFYNLCENTLNICYIVDE